MGPTYYSPDVHVIHHCLLCPHRTLEDVWNMAPKCVYVCVNVNMCTGVLYVGLSFSDMSKKELSIYFSVCMHISYEFIYVVSECLYRVSALQFIQY